MDDSRQLKELESQNEVLLKAIIPHVEETIHNLLMCSVSREEAEKLDVFSGKISLYYDLRTICEMLRVVSNLRIKCEVDVRYALFKNAIGLFKQLRTFSDQGSSRCRFFICVTTNELKVNERFLRHTFENMEIFRQQQIKLIRYKIKKLNEKIFTYLQENGVA
jgi:hypothetical protein